MEDKIKISADEFFALINTSKQRQELIEGTLKNLDTCTVQHQQTVIALSDCIRRYIQHSEQAGDVLPFVWSKINAYNVLFPDIQVICKTVAPDITCYEGVPDWIIEVVSSDASRDYFEKLELYKNLGIREYWIVNPVRTSTTVFSNKSNNLGLYSFEQIIPVDIYGNMQNPLEICIAELL
ncbi:MAG: Uma2 family endonuclease [Oscillospiraceae bacterium]|nr:Uma2 family endonuclease [Oscillospiraceae bacterium]